jgi:TPR repeat protein
MSAPIRLRGRLALLLSVAVLLPCPALAQPPAGKRHALLIGIREYANFDKLQYTENDVEDLAKLLDKGGFAGVRVLTTTRGKQKKADEPNVNNIRAAIKTLLAKKTRTDTILVALSGHGIMARIKEKGTEREESFFCPSDGKKEDTKTLISLRTLMHDIDDCGAGVNLLLVDACRNNPAAGRSVSADTLPRLPRGTAALFSCMSGERAFETDKLPGGRGHGVFFFHVLQGLQGKAKNEAGEITWSRLSDYVTNSVSDAVPKIIGGGARQTPELKVNLTGKSPVLMRALNIDPITPPKIGPILSATRANELFRLAQAHHLGQGKMIDFTEAARLYGQAIDAGSAPAGGFLGLLLAAGQGAARDEEKARRLCAAAAAWARPEVKNGNPTAQVLLGQMHERGLGVPKNEKLAAGFYRKAAARGDLLAEVYLANLLANGRGVKKDEAEAVRRYRHAADKGLALAQTGLGAMYATGRGVPRDAVEAVKWYQKAAAQELPLAQSNLGFMYASGQGVERNDREAVRLYRLAGEKGEAWADTNLGLMHALGRGVTKDAAEAARLYRKAADKGLAQGQLNLGVAYLYGQGVAKDEKEAVRWFRKAADQDHTDAQANLGMLLLAGIGTDKNEAEGARLIRKAAEKGHPNAQLFLGAMYESGQGVQKNVNEARKWYQKAADQGSADARERLEKLKG